MVAVVHANPGDAGGLGFCNSGLRGELHHHMAHAVVAVHEGHAGHFALDAHLRRHVHRARLDAPHVLRQAEYAVAIGAVEVGLRHQAGAGRGIGRGQADAAERGGDK